MCPHPVLVPLPVHHAQCPAGAQILGQAHPGAARLSFLPRAEDTPPPPPPPTLPPFPMEEVKRFCSHLPTREARRGGFSEAAVPDGAKRPYMNWKGVQRGVVGQPGSGVLSLTAAHSGSESWSSGNIHSGVEGGQKGEVRLRHQQFQ